jgi:hypothetical protein
MTSTRSNSALADASEEVGMSTYRNPWHKPNDPPGSEFFTADAKPVQVGRYQRFHRIKSYTPDGNVYDFVLKGVCIAQHAGPSTEAIIDADWHAQETLRKLGFVS